MPIAAGLLLPTSAASAAPTGGLTTTLARRLSATLPRPTGPGIYAYENLGVRGLNLTAGMAAAMSAAKREGRTNPTLTLPPGVFETVGFGQSANNTAYLVPETLSIVGSGPSTVIRAAANSLTSAQAAGSLSIMIVPKGTGIRLAQFRVQGTPQKGKLHGGINVYKCTNPQITDILVTGVPGNFNRPPGETCSLIINNGTGAKLTRVEFDGRDDTGKKVAALGIGVILTSGVELRDCYTHHSGYSHGVSIWQSSNVTS